MRITNQMMTNSTLTNINKNKVTMSQLESQYSTGKKIQRPSEDPIIAVRTLKLRSNLSELNQFLERNIPDALSWMDVTESAMTTANTILTSINTYCNQGVNDTLTAEDRNSIVANLAELSDQIYEEGNSNYAGRYVFTGYKTDTPLTFEESKKNLTYQIEETFNLSDVQLQNGVVGGYSLSDYSNKNNPTEEDFKKTPQLKQYQSIRLAYGTVSSDLTKLKVSYTTVEKDGTKTTVSLNKIQMMPASNPSAYEVKDDIDANYIPETGEFILSSKLYETIKKENNLSISYEKNDFKQGDLMPQHYFNCTCTDSLNPEKGEVKYDLKDGQSIEYEVNFNQKLSVNTEAKNAFLPEIGRQIQAISGAVEAVNKTESEIAEVNKMLENKSLKSEQRDCLTKLKEQLKTQLVLQNEVMTKSFEGGLQASHNQQDVLNVAIADSGSRYKRLELTESRLESQQVEFTELLSSNEDADLVETVIKYNSQETIYNAALSAASKIVKNTLLDFL